MIKSAVSSIILLLPVLVLSLLAESAFPDGWPRPELSVIFICVIALRFGAEYGAVFGLLAGAVSGLLGSGSPGMSAFVYAMTGAVIGSTLHQYRDRYSVYILADVSATVLLGVALVAAGRLGADVPNRFEVSSWLLTALIWNLVCLQPVLWLSEKILGTRPFNPLKLDCGKV